MAAAPSKFIALKTYNALKKILLGYGANFYKLFHRQQQQNVSRFMQTKTPINKTLLLKI